MEIRAGPSDLELSQRNFHVVSDEYRKLCYEMKTKELARNSTHVKMQQQIRQQWETILELKKQKSELTLKLRFQESESFSNKANKNYERFMKSLEELIKLEAHAKMQAETHENYKHEILEFDKKLRQKQKEVVKAQRGKGRVLQNQKNITFLENRLNSSLHRYNQLLVSNNALREEISSLLLTQSSFRKKYGCVKRLLALGKKTLAEVVHAATVSYQIGESVKYKFNMLRERTQVDQKKLGEKIKELEILVEQDKKLKEFLEFKRKDISGSSESEETSKNEQIIEQRLQAYSGIMARIKLASNCKDVNQICKTYIQEEESNLNLFEKVNELSLEIEKLHEEVRVERQEVEKITQLYKEQARKDLAAKHDIESITYKLQDEALQLERVTDAKAEELEEIKEIVYRIYDFLDEVSSQKVSFTVDIRITDDNILQYLEALERRIIDFIRCKKLFDSQSRDIKKNLLQGLKSPWSQKPLPSNSKQRERSTSVTCLTNERRKQQTFDNIQYNKKSLETFSKYFQEKS